MTPLRIFVRRGALRRFHRLTKESEGLPVKVEWDRRQAERRAEPADPAAAQPTEKRRSDRRREPPFTWRAAEFVVVNEPPDPTDAQDTNGLPDPDDSSKK